MTVGYFGILVCVSIHALLAESDLSRKRMLGAILGCVSIHALLAESD